MSRHARAKTNLPLRKAKHHNGVAKARSARASAQSSNRTRGGERNERLPFAPPENWYEPEEDVSDYRIIVQSPGEGFKHVVTPEEVRNRLSDVPPQFLQGLEVVQLSRMTKKKQCFPCYGMQWGSALYLYPLETSLEEVFYQPPRPSLVNETKMYGARWFHEAPHTWRLVWNENSIKDFYLNNILIHELGHLLDDRNSGYVDRERFAEWFAIHHGYRPTQRQRSRRRKNRVVRRHHAS